jgi:hypothetical protein
VVAFVPVCVVGHAAGDRDPVAGTPQWPIVKIDQITSAITIARPRTSEPARW